MIDLSRYTGAAMDAWLDAQMGAMSTADKVGQLVFNDYLDAGLTVLWFVVSACSYDQTDIERYQAVLDPKKPLDVQDFDTVSDWRQAELVEDLLWSDERQEWVLKSKARGDTSVWCGTYEVAIQFPKGQHQIELKIISRVPEVCSIVLSNWKVYVR